MIGSALWLGSKLAGKSTKTVEEITMTGDEIDFLLATTDGRVLLQELELAEDLAVLKRWQE